MARTNFFYGVLLSGTMISGMFGTLAFAADLDVSGNLPAVSAVNGKVEFQGGWADGDGISGDELGYAGAALSIPMGESFGLQADVAALRVFDETAVGGALHFFTRDPNSHLLGAIGGYVDTGVGHMLWGGAEAEAYLGNITLRGIAGLSDTSISGLGSETDFLGIGEASLYATDDLRFSATVSSVAEFESGSIGMEWLMQEQLGMPVSFKAEAGMGENGYHAASAGLTLYFGGSENNKSLIRRHREDDPAIEAFPSGPVNFFGAGVLGNNGSPACVPDSDILNTFGYDTCLGEYVDR